MSSVYQPNYTLIVHRIKFCHLNSETRMMNDFPRASKVSHATDKITKSHASVPRWRDFPKGIGLCVLLYFLMHFSFFFLCKLWLQLQVRTSVPCKWKIWRKLFAKGLSIILVTNAGRLSLFPPCVFIKIHNVKISVLHKSVPLNRGILYFYFTHSLVASIRANLWSYSFESWTEWHL